MEITKENIERLKEIVKKTKIQDVLFAIHFPTDKKPHLSIGGDAGSHRIFVTNSGQQQDNSPEALLEEFMVKIESSSITKEAEIKSLEDRIAILKSTGFDLTNKPLL